ncbi:hypothetical protein ACWDA7_49480, partial [Streptomyces sp. NPDC001156]
MIQPVGRGVCGPAADPSAPLCATSLGGYSAAEGGERHRQSRGRTLTMTQHVRDIMTSAPVTVEPQASV